MATQFPYAVSGAGGYVGSILKMALGGDQSVVGLVRTPRQPQDIAWSFTEAQGIAGQLRERGVKVLVHAAWDMKASSAEEIDRICVEGSRRLFEAADQAGVERIVFISTISAFEGCQSVYGQKKVEVEHMIRARGGTVLRLGLVFGPNPGGAFGNLYKQVDGPFVPVINTGQGPQYLLAEQTLAETIQRAVWGDFDDLHGSPLTLANPTPISFRELLHGIAGLKNTRARILPVPWQLLYGGLRTAEALGVKLPVRSDSVVSIVHANPAPDFAPMLEHGIHPLAFPQGLSPARQAH